MLHIRDQETGRVVRECDIPHQRTTIERAEAQVLAFVEAVGIEVLKLDQEDTSLALQAYALYGLSG
jgi:uncharacterized protein with PIN domain